MERAREVFGLSTVGMGGAAIAAGLHTAILYAPNIIDYCKTFGELLDSLLFLAIRVSPWLDEGDELPGNQFLVCNRLKQIFSLRRMRLL